MIGAQSRARTCSWSARRDTPKQSRRPRCRPRWRTSSTECAAVNRWGVAQAVRALGPWKQSACRRGTAGRVGVGTHQCRARRWQPSTRHEGKPSETRGKPLAPAPQLDAVQRVPPRTSGADTMALFVTTSRCAHCHSKLRRACVCAPARANAPARQVRSCSGEDQRHRRGAVLETHRTHCAKAARNGARCLSGSIALQRAARPQGSSRHTANLAQHDDRIFSEAEEAQLQQMLEMDAEQLATVLQACCYVFERAGYMCASPAKLVQGLTDCGLTEAHVRFRAAQHGQPCLSGLSMPFAGACIRPRMGGGT